MSVRVLFIFIFAIACQADIQVSPPVRCGYLPRAIHECIGSPHIVKPEISAQCSKSISECERMTCVFQKSGWMNGNAVDKDKVKGYFDEFSKDNPQWAPAVNHVKAACLNIDLPSQGVYLNCPAYDILTCVFSGFIKNAQPDQWSSSESCSYPRQFASACPYCPSDCFAAQVPIGSCNACLALLRSP
uniref:Odorant binding protein 41 n=1 Tax=Heliconius charithonia TaxID=33434 RepID=A0AA49EZX4_HELCH|nr:odorant binding protein 41 [Heliconius charithonia]